MKIHGRVRTGRGVYGPGDEEKLAAEINETDAKRLAAKGVITLEGGEKFSSRKAQDSRRRERKSHNRGSAFTGGGESIVPEGGKLDDLSKDELQKFADDFGIEVKGTGAGGNVLKSDLVKAIQNHEKSKG